MRRPPVRVLWIVVDRCIERDAHGPCLGRLAREPLVLNPRPVQGRVVAIAAVGNRALQSHVEALALIGRRAAPKAAAVPPGDILGNNFPCAGDGVPIWLRVEVAGEVAGEALKRMSDTRGT